VLVTVVLAQRFFATPDGAIWTANSYPYRYWQRYLETFAGVRVVARVLAVADRDLTWKRVDGPCVSVSRLPYYHGPQQYILRRGAVHRTARAAVARDNAVILRVPLVVARSIVLELGKRRQPYGLHVVGDPSDVFARGVVRHPLRPFLRWYAPKMLRYVVSRGAAVAYVTERTLQRRYPADSKAFVTHFSSIELPADAFVSSARTYANRLERALRVVCVGSLEQMYKAPDVVIKAIACCVEQGVDCECVWVGDGKYRARVGQLSKKSGCPERFHFTGNLPGHEAVRSELDDSDVFVLMSRTEGLPRAMIEAMARGLPCIGSTAGGIPELLSPEWLVPPDNHRRLAERLAHLYHNPHVMTGMSASNLLKAGEYRDELLSRRRVAFMSHLRMCTECYLSRVEVAGKRPGKFAGDAHGH
jgi:glycosyltransferase involved in cell wall biosynthesis